MKRILSLFGLFFITGFYLAQNQASITENFIYTKNCLDGDCIKKAESVQYFDGLGRAKQAVNIKESPLQKDVIVHFEYDSYGRQVKSYLPIPQSGTQNGAIYTSPLSSVSAVYGGEKIYEEKVLDNSPLNRIKQIINVGNDWQNKPVNYGRDFNSISDAVRIFTVNTLWANNAGVSTVKWTSEYDVNKLYKNSVSDEDGNLNTVFTNTAGQQVLIRKNNGTQTIDTYYIYNEYDQIAFILPAKALDVFFNDYGAGNGDFIPDDILNSLCYQYRYDEWGRQVEKKLPGKEWEYFVYDKQDRPILYQDTNLKNQGNWIFTKYDKFGRTVYTGITSNSGSRNSVQSIVNTNTSNQYNTELRTQASFSYNGLNVYYSNNAYPTDVSSILSVNYYDQYPPDSPAFSNTFSQDILSGNMADVLSTKSLPTASFIKNIENDNWTKNYYWYNNKGNVIGTHSSNHLGGYTKTESNLDFVGVAQETQIRHKRLSSDYEIIIAENFEYDPQYRLKKNWHRVGISPSELLGDYTYNELSQLITKRLGNNLERIDYQYNIRGWLTKINDPSSLNGKLFGYEIKYQNPANISVATPKYNGNISEIDWKTANGNLLKRYSYTYDRLDRLLDAFYQEPLATVPMTNGYGESSTYDLNGNIKTLKRFGSYGGTPILIDDLKYSYQEGNRLSSVVDVSNNNSGYPIGGSGFDYDPNGNMTVQLDKGINQITYNFLNLPTEVNYTNFVDYKLKFLYRADGTKLQKSFIYYNGRCHCEITEDTQYLDSFQYVGNGLQFFPTSEGYYDFKNSRYVYQYKDQVGNIRISFYNNGSQAAIDKETNYYPFGLEYFGPNGTYPLNNMYKYGFQEQELQTEIGWSSFKWRNYDPALGRFFNVDPLSEKYAYQSHYNFSENRIINSRELEGLESIDNNGDFTDHQEAADFAREIGGYVVLRDFEFAEVWQDIEGVTVTGNKSESDGDSIIESETDGNEFDWEDAALTALDFTPIGDFIGMYEGARDGDWAKFGINAGFAVIGIATGGSGSLIKGGLKTAGKAIAEEALEEAGEWAIKEATELALEATAKRGGRAFFSGAGTEARAISDGYKTLGQTRAGKNLQDLIDGKNIPWSEAEPMWQRLSATWANGVPNGSSVPVFLNDPRPAAIWFQTELPILQKKGVNIIYK